MASTCKRCNAPIIWVETPKGKNMPCDEGLVPYRANKHGGSTVVNDRGEVIRCDIITDGSTPDGLARKTHWETCPFAAEFHGKGGGKNG